MSVRARTTLAATVAVGLALLVAAYGLLVVQRRTLVENLDEVADLRAAGIAALDADGAGSPAPGAARALELATDDDELVRVVTETGATKAETPGFRDDLAGFRPSGADAEVRTVDGWRVTAYPGDGIVVYVATSLEPVDESVAALRGGLVVGGPLLLLLVALIAWVVVGRALRPVDAISAEVAAIGDRSLDRRVPVPRAEDEIARLATTMNTMLERLETGVARQRRFVADASHELRTPLAALRADLEAAPPDERRDDLLATTMRMERLVHDLLYLARADAGVPSARTPIDLEEVVLDEVARSRHPVDTAGVSAAPVVGNRDELARVVRNLLDNATRHAVHRVEVRVAADDGHAVLTVADDGPGIAPHDRDRVFERFTRLDDARARDGGAGLGLAIAREIVVAHGGTITVDGSRFEVRLPRA